MIEVFPIISWGVLGEQGQRGVCGVFSSRHHLILEHHHSAPHFHQGHLGEKAQGGQRGGGRSRG